ncbi:MAG: AI-2E family transporter [Candidatus Saccharibacteria bacterium]|jgi:predicted PurR-regulated permease PerM
MSSKTPQTVNIQISPKSIFLVLGVLLAAYIIYLLGDFLILMFASGVVAVAVAPFVRRLEARGLPRWAAVSLLYLFVILFIALALLLIIPTLTNQIGQLVEAWPKSSQSIQDYVSRNQLLRSAFGGVNFGSIASGDLLGRVVNITSGVFNGLAATVLFLVVTFYYLVHGRRLVRYFLQLIPDVKQRHRTANLLARISERMGFWFRGQFVISLTTFFVTWLAFSLLGVPYALTLAMIAGLAEFIPLFGSWIGGGAAVLVALGQSPSLAIFVGVFFLAWQSFQAYVISPQVMRQTLGIPSIFVLLSVLLFAKLIGFVGVFLAAPIAAAIGVIAQEYSGGVQERVREGLARAGQRKA